MGESHVVSALKAKRAALAGEAEAVERHLAQLRADLVHVDVVLRMFDVAADPDAIPARRPYKRRGWFSDGELPRRILAALRASEVPLSATEIAVRVMAQKDLAPGDVDTLLLIRKSVAAYLRNRQDGLVRRTASNGRDVRWQIGAIAPGQMMERAQPHCPGEPTRVR